MIDRVLAVGFAGLAGTLLALMLWPSPARPPQAPRPPTMEVQESPSRRLGSAPIVPAPGVEARTAARQRPPAARATPTRPRRTQAPVREMLVDLPPGAVAGPAPREPEEVVRESIRAARRTLEECYDRALRDNRKVQGHLVVEIAIRLSGEVESAEVVETDLQDRRVEGCIAARLKRLRFPAFGEEVAVRVPVTLVHAG